MRKKNKISAEELAEMLNITVRHLYDLETGKVQLAEDRIKYLCDRFNVTSDYLLGLTDDPHPPRSLQDKVFDPAYTPTEVDLEELLKVANIRFRGDPLDTEDRENLLKIAEILWNERRKIELDRRK